MSLITFLHLGGWDAEKNKERIRGKNNKLKPPVSGSQEQIFLALLLITTYLLHSCV